MHKHVRTHSRARPLPTAKPVQLPLPGIPEKPRYLNSLPDRVRETITRYRYPLLVTTLILILYLIGQGTIATGLLFAVSLFAVNTLVDGQMGGDRDE